RKRHTAFGLGGSQEARDFRLRNSQLSEATARKKDGPVRALPRWPRKRARVRVLLCSRAAAAAVSGVTTSGSGGASRRSRQPGGAAAAQPLLSRIWEHDLRDLPRCTSAAARRGG